MVHLFIFIRVKMRGTTIYVTRTDHKRCQGATRNYNGPETNPNLNPLRFVAVHRGPLWQIVILEKNEHTCVNQGLAELTAGNDGNAGHPANYQADRPAAVAVAAGVSH